MSNCEKCKSLSERFKELKKKIVRHNKRQGKIRDLMSELHDLHKFILDNHCADCKEEPNLLTEELKKDEVRRPDVDEGESSAESSSSAFSSSYGSSSGSGSSSPSS